jgi:hypothetical protein
MPFARILLDRLEEPVSALAGEVAVRHQKGFVNESRGEFEHVVLADAVASANMLSSFDRPRRRE